MDVKLISPDPDLYKLCREILAEIPGHYWTISAVTAQDAGADSDLYLWDFQPNISLPEHINWNPSKNLFLVHRKELATFHKQTEAAETNILLKPVTRATLAAFLSLAVSAHEERISAASSLRADRDEILQCLIQTNLKLQEYDQDRTNFLARAVHDFRAPLTALSGYCGLLLGEPTGPLNEYQREVLRRMQHSAKRLSRMAAAMFQLSVGLHVKRRPDLQKGDIRECLEQALHEITPFAEDKRIAIEVDLSPSDDHLYFEAGQIEQVLINILDNACKFTPKAGSIEIRGYPYFWDRRTSNSEMTLAMERRRHTVREANSYRIDIRDSGTPIPLEYLSRIFEEYTSYAGGRDRSGGGLGLAICRMIITQHDGHVWAENTDSGPAFSLVLPVYRLEGPTQAATNNDSLRFARVS
jgi:signal transduction histidine kinase